MMLYTKKKQSPLPQTISPETTEMLRPIANLLNCIKVMEKVICEMMISDMKDMIDPSQYGNQPKTIIQQYLIRLFHRILTATTRMKTMSCSSPFVDWCQAYSCQCHTFEVQSYISNGVRPALIPVLISYFQH